MTNVEWIKKHLEAIGMEDDELTRKMYDQYDKFQKETKSSMSFDSYKRAVRKKIRRMSSNYDESGNDRRYLNVQDEGNVRIVSYKGPRIVTVDQLLDFCEIDSDEWNIDRSIINKWEVGRKNKKIDLDWDEGRMSGSVLDQGNFFVEPLIQVKVWLSRKVLKKSYLPPLRSISISPSKTKHKIKYKSLTNPKTAFILADAQMGFIRNAQTGKLYPLHDRRVFSIALSLIEKRQPDLLVLNGDMFDFADLSDKFINSPDYYNSIQPAFIEFGWWMQQFREVCPSMEIVYLAGNHEDRLRKHLIKYSAYAYGLKSIDKLGGHDVLSIPHLCSFDELNVKWREPYNSVTADFWLNDDFLITHGSSSTGKSGGTVSKIITDATCSQIVGHIHRFESAEKVIDVGGSRKDIQVWTFGTMCRVDGVVPAHKEKVNWQQGFGEIHYFDNDSLTEIIPIKVSNGRCIYDSEVLIGIDPSSDIARDINWDVLDIS